MPVYVYTGVHVCVCLCVCMSIYMCAYGLYFCVHTCSCIYVCAFMCECICVCAHMCFLLTASVHVLVFVNACVCFMCVCWWICRCCPQVSIFRQVRDWCQIPSSISLHITFLRQGFFVRQKLSALVKLAVQQAALLSP